MFAGSLKTSLLMANCSRFLLQRQGALGRRSWMAVSGTAIAEVDDKRKRCRPGSPVTGCKASPGRPAQVHGDTGRLVQPVCMIFALVHAANEDTEAEV